MLYDPKKQIHPKAWGLRAAAVSIVLGASIAGSSFGVSADTVSDLKQQLATLQQQSQTLQQELNDQNSKLKTEQDKKAAIDAQVANTQKQISILQAQIDATNAQIAVKQKDIDNTQKSVDENYDLLKQRMRTLYMAGNESYLTVLLSSDSLPDFLNNAEVIRTVSKHDSDIVDGLKADEERLKTDKATLDTSMKNLTAQQGTIAAKQEVLHAQQATQAQAVAQAQSAANSVQQQNDLVKQQAAKTDAQIDAEIAAQAAAARARAQAAAAALKAKQTSTTATTGGASTSPSADPGSGNLGDINYLLQYANGLSGVPYVTNGDSPSGFDCSGFVQYVFANAAGIGLPHKASEMYQRGTPVSNPQPGDLVFFNTTGENYSHVGIYVGNGNFIGAQSSTGVGTTSLSLSYWKTRYEGAVRILG